jgi:hypothetical protein
VTSRASKPEPEEWIYADAIVRGMRIIPPGKVRPVTVGYQLEPHGERFYFACQSKQGSSALALWRSDKVRLVGSDPSIIWKDD